MLAWLFLEEPLFLSIRAATPTPQTPSPTPQVTPAHDPNDYKCGKRHGLPFVTVFTEDGRVSDAGGELFAGMMRFDARVAVLKVRLGRWFV